MRSLKKSVKKVKRINSVKRYLKKSVKKVKKINSIKRYLKKSIKKIRSVKKLQIGGRHFSKEYCKKKPCLKMGFSEKASCRPYKNCYKKSLKK